MSNESVMKAGLREFAEKQIKKQLLSALRDVSETMLGLIDNAFPVPGGSEQYPVWSGNMRDSTGIGVYADGALMSFIPSKVANAPQTYGTVQNIWGTEYLQTLLAQGTSVYSKGVWLVLFSAVPYAYRVDTFGSPWKRGIGYFDRITEELLRQLSTKLGFSYTPIS
jgi:hypothetical protein